MATCPQCRVIYGEGEQVCPNDGQNLLPDEAFSAVDPDLQEGDQVGEYKIERKLGEGGFGVVFAAVQPLIGKQVAIKVLNRQYSSNPQMVSRFIAEARAVNQIRHRNIIDIFSFGQLTDGRHYYVMELLTGVTLDRYLADRGRLAISEAIPILRALARALDAAHAKGIAHRDLKPENIFISHDDDGSPFPKLLDFGIAKLLASDAQLQHKTRTGAPIGTPYYMSPEQCRGRDVDHRTDVYSFGIMLYQMVTGQLPFTGQDFMEILLKQISEAPVTPSHLVEMPEALDEKILWFLQKDPAARPPNLVTGVRALEEAAQGAGIALPMAPTGVYGTQPTPTPNSMPNLPTPTPNRITPGGVGATQARELGSAKTIGAVSPTPGYLAAEASAPPAPRKGKTGLIVAFLGVVVVGGVGAFFVMKRPEQAAVAEPAPKRTAPEPTPEATPPAAKPEEPPEPVNPPEPPTPPPSSLAGTVVLDVQGVPEGTEVIGPDGTMYGNGPGKVNVPRGEDPLRVEFRAKGYRTEGRRIIPNADVVVTVQLEKKTGRPKDKERAGKDGKPDKDAIEDAFDE